MRVYSFKFENLLYYLGFALIGLTTLSLVSASTASALATDPQLVSVPQGGGYGNGSVHHQPIRSLSASDDGNVVAFVSTATNMTPDVFYTNPDPYLNNGCGAVFVRDRVQSVTKLISKNLSGQLLNACQALNYKILTSGNGRYVFYTTGSSTNTGVVPAPNPGIGGSAILRYDLSNDTIQHVGAQADTSSGPTAVDYSGTKLVVNNGLYDLTSNTFTQIPNAQIKDVASDGTTILYAEGSSLKLKDLSTGIITTVTQQATSEHEVSRNGKYVYFTQGQGNYPGIGAECSSQLTCLYQYNVDTGLVKEVKVTVGGFTFYPLSVTSISGDGTRILVTRGTPISSAINPNSYVQSFGITGMLLINIATGENHLVGYGTNWQQPEAYVNAFLGTSAGDSGFTGTANLTADGMQVVYASNAGNNGTPPNCPVPPIYQFYKDPLVNQCFDVYIGTTAARPAQPPSATTLTTIALGTVTPSLANGDYITGLNSSSQTEAATFGFTALYNTLGSPTILGASVFNYLTGGPTCLINIGTNCHNTTLVSITPTSYTTFGQNNQEAILRGSATFLVDGQTSAVPVRITAVDGDRATPVTGDLFGIKIYPADYNPLFNIYSSDGSVVSAKSLNAGVVTIQ